MNSLRIMGAAVGPQKPPKQEDLKFLNSGSEVQYKAGSRNHCP